MNHQKYLEWIQLYLYNELTPEEKIEFEKHIKFCRECNAEFESQKKFKDFLSRDISYKVNANLLAEARAQLQYALREERKKSFFWKNLLENIQNFSARNYKPVFGGIALLLLGMLISYLFIKPQNQIVVTQNTDNTNSEAASFTSDTRITNLRFIDQDASDGEIEFIFEAVKPVRIKGNVSDEKIKNILTYSMLNEENPGVRLNSINAMSNKKTEEDSEIKEAAINVLKYDDNPGVRREALKLLNKFQYDSAIKDALLYVLMNDTNSGLRIEAINRLSKAGKEGDIKFDEEDIKIIKEKMNRDENSYVRFQAKNVVKEIY